MVSTALPNLSTAVNTLVLTTVSIRVVMAVKTNHRFNLDLIFRPRLCSEFDLELGDEVFIYKVDLSDPLIRPTPQSKFRT